MWLIFVTRANAPKLFIVYTVTEQCFHKTWLFHKKITKLNGCNRFQSHCHLQTNMLTCYMAVNFNKHSNVSFLTVVCTVFISSKYKGVTETDLQKRGTALVKTIASFIMLFVVRDRVGI